MGGFAGNHQKAVRLLEEEGEFRLGASCDPNLPAFAEAMESWEYSRRGVKVFSGYLEMLDACGSGLDMVVVPMRGFGRRLFGLRMPSSVIASSTATRLIGRMGERTTFRFRVKTCFPRISSSSVSICAENGNDLSSLEDVLRDAG